MHTKQMHCKQRLLLKMHFFLGWLLNGSTSPLSGRSPSISCEKFTYVASKELDIKNQRRNSKKKYIKTETQRMRRQRVASSTVNQSRARSQEPKARMLIFPREMAQFVARNKRNCFRCQVKHWHRLEWSDWGVTNSTRQWFFVRDGSIDLVTFNVIVS